MSFILKVRTDDNFEDLKFANLESAENFREFIELYYRQSGAGNGYSAYWLYDWDIYEVNPIPPAAVLPNRERILRMLSSVAFARSAGEGDWFWTLTLGVRKGAAIFQVGDLPAVVSPQVGDLCRHINRDRPPGRFEGRVVEIRDGMAKILSCFSENGDGQATDNARYEHIPLASLMKIPDWVKELRENRNQPV